MSRQDAYRILVINSGSSSLKFALFQMGEAERLDCSGKLDRIGLEGGAFQVRDAVGAVLVNEEHLELADHETALRRLLDWLAETGRQQELTAAAHRVVHGGPHHTQPERITPELIAELEQLTPLAPNHLPAAREAIQAIGRVHPRLTQFACFDTAFHRTLPRAAQQFALPGRYAEEGVLRYGFHGLSYEYIVQELSRVAGAEAADGRLIVAHLGNGASMAAVHQQRSLDTTMGFTPTGGLVMSTRSGDLDPGLLLYLLRQRGMSADELHELLTQQSGLLGLSGVSSDMHDLLSREAADESAALAIEIFCYQARKFIGAFAAALGGLDQLIFTGGIGEHAAPIRERICEPLGFLGIELEAPANGNHAAVISREGSSVTVRVIPTNEELMMARHARGLLRKQANGGLR
jgi:acetate kinase